MATILDTDSAMAKALKVTPQAFQRAKDAGRVTPMADGRWCVATVRRQFAARSAPQSKPGRPRKHAAPDNAEISYAEARRLKEIALAERAQLDLAKARDELVDRRAVETAVLGLARAERDAWLQLPPRVAAILAAELGCDARALELALDREMRTHMHAQAALTPAILAGLNDA